MAKRKPENNLPDKPTYQELINCIKEVSAEYRALKDAHDLLIDNGTDNDDSAINLMRWILDRAERGIKIMEYNQLSLFARAYIEAILFTECNPDNEELDGKDFEDFAPETIQQIITDCERFQGHNVRLLALAGDDSQNGHDFWLTRNHHGAGFWDRGYGQIGEELTKAAQAYKERTLVLGGHGLLYLEG